MKEVPGTKEKVENTSISREIESSFIVEFNENSISREAKFLKEKHFITLLTAPASPEG